MFHRILLTIFIIVILSDNVVYASNVYNENLFIHGTVLEILEDETDEANMIRTQTINIRIDEKGYNSQIITINHMCNIASIHHMIVEPNYPVIIWVNIDDTLLENCKIYSYGRDRYLLYLIGVFVLFILLIGGKKGFSSIISLALTLGLIFFIFFPMIINGVNPITAAVIVCIISSFITLVSIGNFTVKTYSAIIGTLGGIFFAIILTYIFGSLTHIQGIEDDSAEILSYFPRDFVFDFRQVLYAGIIIGSLGAIMDIGMSIASAMHEISEANPRLSNTQLFLSGMRVGKDAMGTMSNTLILAYVGSSINLLIVFYIYGLNFIQFINGDGISSEILRTFAGSIGLVLSIPITSFSYILFRARPSLQMHRSY